MAEVTRRARDFADRYGKLYPKAVSGRSDDFASLTVHLRFPRQHWKQIRHSNFIERTFGESRRRVKVIGRLPGRDQLLVAGVGGAGPGQSRLAGCHSDIGDRPAPPGSAPPTAGTTGRSRRAPQHAPRRGGDDRCRGHQRLN